MFAKVILWVLSCIPHLDIYRQGGLYLRRYYLLGGPRYGIRKHFPWNVYLHCFFMSDAPVPHNHPWVWAKSLILRGAYLEHRWIGRTKGGTLCLEKRFVRSAGKWHTLYGSTFHYVDLITPTVWTLFITGPRMSDEHEGAWGFQTPSGYVPEHVYKKRLGL